MISSLSIVQKRQAPIRPPMSAQCGSSLGFCHAGKVAVLVSRLALPTPPTNEVALWTKRGFASRPPKVVFASCNTLCRAPSFPDKITTKSLRETCEAVRDAADQYRPLLGAAAARQPLDAEEKSTLEPMRETVLRKHFFVLGMSMNLHLAGDLVYTGPSPVHGLGVFAAADMPKHTCFTAYPTDLLELWEDAATRCSVPKARSARAPALFSRKHEDVDGNVRLRRRLKGLFARRPHDVLARRLRVRE